MDTVRISPAVRDIRRRIVRWSVALGALFLVAALMVSQAVAVAAPASQRGSDPITPSRISLSIDGHEIASFSDLVAITAEVEPNEHLDGGGSRKSAGRLKPPVITLRRGFTHDIQLWTWHEAVRSGQASSAFKSVSLIMYNADGKPVARYALENAWPPSSRSAH